MKVYITKYALTKGVIEMEVNISHASTMVVANDRFRTTYHKPFWHENEQDAIIHANKMRENKINSLQKQIDKLIKTIF